MNKILMKISLLLSLLLLNAHLTLAQVRLPRLIRDSMILQRDEKIKLWGWAAPHEKLKIRFNGKTYNSRADVSGNWMAMLPPVKAGGPYTMDIIASNRIKIKEILFGDVWFFSGQSNMVHQLNIHDITYAREIEEADFPQIRQFLIPTRGNLEGPQHDLASGYWKPAVGADVRPFSAVAYFFSKKIHEKYRIPVGIINASVGGSPIEAWISEEGFKEFPDVFATIEKNKDSSYTNRFNRPMGNRPAAPIDAGMVAAPKWFDSSYIPKGWRRINIPGYWEDQGIKDLNGIVWYRREIDLPVSMAGKSAKVFMGRIVDADELYINGKLVGTTTYQYPQRRYIVPAGLLKAGKNVFVSRVTNTNGKGGFVPDKPYCIFSGTDTVDLKGYWSYKVGVAFKPFAGGGSWGSLNVMNQPAALYNNMVAPEINCTIRGICWYQGETNADQAEKYTQLLPTLISDWRKKWNNASLPFLFVQLPGFMEYSYLPSESNWALLRESQLNSLFVPNTAMAVAIDLGEWNDIHPDNKKDVGERLALAALKVAYKEDIVYSGPLYDSALIEGNRISISFKQTGSGLTTNDGEGPSSFAIAGADRRFVWATAKIEGNKVVVWNDEINEPKFVRYAWADNPVDPNLINKEGLPASPFRTDK
ncbi:MAG: sialate O-acetylesterase [Chitinophagaceae bacterium]